VTLTLDLLTQKSLGITCGSWPFIILRMVNLGEISLKLMSRQDFAYSRQTDRCTTCAITKYDRRCLRAYKKFVFLLTWSRCRHRGTVREGSPGPRPPSGSSWTCVHGRNTLCRRSHVSGSGRLPPHAETQEMLGFFN